jgi:hypothetical protein
MVLQIKDIVDDRLCYEKVRELRWSEGVYEKRPQEILEGEIEFDELYLVAGHKGKPDAVKKKT